MRHVRIAGTGGYLPEKILTNYDLEKIVDTSHDWIVERTGIHARHVAADHQTPTDLAEIAARRALESANLSANDIDMIIVTTTTPEYVFPSTACLLQARLGLSKIPTFDLNSVACTGFIYALSIAEQYIKTGSAKHILLVASEIMTRVVDWNDRSTCVLFGDGAGAMILSESQNPSILSTHLFSDGKFADVLKLSPCQFQQNHYVKMQGSALFKLAVNILDELFDETLAAHHIQKSELDWLVPHQANVRIIQAMAKKLELPMERAVITLDKQANTSSASIPLALDFAVRTGQIQRGQLLLLEGIGGGLTYGSALVRF